MTDYLTQIEVLAVHADQIERYGGVHGVRDYGLLESALYRPQTGYYLDLIEEAAALWESLAQNHPFLDGNKRTGFVLGVCFLERNGFEFHATEAEAVLRTLALAAGEMGEAEFAQWMKANSKRA